MDPLFVAPTAHPIDLVNKDARAAALDPVTRDYRASVANVLGSSAKKRFNMAHSVPFIEETDERFAKIEFTAIQKLTNTFMRLQKDSIMFAIVILVVLLFLLSSFYVFLFQNTILGSIILSIGLAQVLQPMDYFVPGIIREKIRNSTESFLAGPKSYNRMLDHCKRMSSEFWTALIELETSKTNDSMFIVNGTEMTIDDVMRNYIEKYYMLILSISHISLRIFIGYRDNFAIPFNAETFHDIETMREWLDDKDDPISILRGLVVQAKRVVIKCTNVGICDKLMFNQIIDAGNMLLDEVDRVQMDTKVKAPAVIAFFLSFILIAYFFILYPIVVYQGVEAYSVFVFPVVCVMALAIPYLSFWIKDPFADNSRSKSDVHGWRVAAQTNIAKDFVYARNFFREQIGKPLQCPVRKHTN